MNKFKVIVCASGNGGNFQKIIDERFNVGYTITKLICDRKCGAVQRAIDNNLKYVIIDKKNLPKEEYEKRFEQELDDNTDLIVLAGFASIISDSVCKKWKYKIINTHPSLLPKYGGIGMYGVRVQEAVMANKEEYGGCTIHFVTPVVDGGEIICQKKVKVDYNQTPWELGGRIFNEEGPLLVKAIQELMKEPTRLQGNRSPLFY